jgi:hypothetical protein
MLSSHETKECLDRFNTNELLLEDSLSEIKFFSMALPTHSGPRPLIQFRNHFGLLGRVISPSQGRCINTGHHKHRINPYTHHQTSMPCVGFEPTIPAAERAKTVHALDPAASVAGRLFVYLSKYKMLLILQAALSWLQDLEVICLKRIYVNLTRSGTHSVSEYSPGIFLSKMKNMISGSSWNWHWMPSEWKPETVFWNYSVNSR